MPLCAFFIISSPLVALLKPQLPIKKVEKSSVFPASPTVKIFAFRPKKRYGTGQRGTGTGQTPTGQLKNLQKGEKDHTGPPQKGTGKGPYPTETEK